MVAGCEPAAMAAGRAAVVTTAGVMVCVAAGRATVVAKAGKVAAMVVAGRAGVVATAGKVAVMVAAGGAAAAASVGNVAVVAAGSAAVRSEGCREPSVVEGEAEEEEAAELEIAASAAAPVVMATSPSMNVVAGPLGPALRKPQSQSSELCVVGELWQHPPRAGSSKSKKHPSILGCARPWPYRER
jgi:hypothetical protein